MNEQEYKEMRNKKYEEFVQIYNRQKVLMDGVSKGDINSIYAMVDDLIEGKSAYSSPATDIIIAAKKLEKGADLLERIITESKKDDVRGFEIWGGALRCSAASFALKTLVEDFNYSPEKASELAEQFNVNVATPGEHLNNLYVHNGAYLIDLKSGIMKKAA